MNTIEQSICEAIDIIVNKAISEAGYDKTIQGIIESCVDATIGKYRVKYQDSVFYAYSSSSEITYTNGSVVYVLIPGNDMSRDKTILGTTKKLGINYVVTAEGDEAYDVNGTNCVLTPDTFSLWSYKQGTNVKVLYHKDYASNDNLININKTAVDQYLKESGSIICGANVRTNLPSEQQLKGNYGIIFALNFLDNTSNSDVTRYFIVDVDKMIGNPYRLVYDTRQYSIFDIDNVNFKEIEYIALFTSDFPHTKPDDQYVEDDIFISKIELSGATRLSNDDINNYSLSFITPQGTYFDDNNLDTDTILLRAQVRVKGKVIDNDSQQLPFYWFTPHVGVTSKSEFYNKYGGQGWKCLNDYNVIEPTTETEPQIVEWIPASYQWIITKSDIVAKEVEYKCAVVYDNTVITKTIVIKNLSAAHDITITSDEGEQFYFDNGFPTLTCLVDGASMDADSYNYSWSVTDNTGAFQTMPETPELNDEYHALKDEYDQLIKDIEEEKQTVVLTKDRLAELEKRLNDFEHVTRVEKNKIHNLNVNTITNFSTYQCTVYYNNIYLGTASIILKNNLTQEGAYSLIINDGSYTYKYNESGVSPASASLDNPIEIKALTFSVYNNLGQKIEDDVIRHADIRWIVPNTNTMIKIPSGTYEGIVNPLDETTTYLNIMSFSYQIEERYDVTKTRNNIELQVNYKDMQLTAKTDLTFIKEGESGTNGTEYTCRIVPNVASGPTPMYPILTFVEGRYLQYMNYTTSGSKLFRAQLWHNEEKIFDGTESGQSSDRSGGVAVVWSILKNKYSNYDEDISSLNVDSVMGTFSYNGYKVADAYNPAPANIVKVALTYNGITYYATIPVITVRILDSDYKVDLKENTGFRYAIYSADGRFPKYDNIAPFELIVNQLVDRNTDSWEDISTKTSDDYKVDYEWRYLGSLKEYNNNDAKWYWKDSINLEDRIIGVRDLPANQKSCKPVDEFDGYCVTNAIEAIIYKKDKDSNRVEKARIHIPIHLLLNRYGQAALNQWDGNSIEISEEGGFILSPQVGAGQKEDDNSFTGVLIGKVQETNNPNPEVGLFGYYKGARSIFLDAETGKAEFGQNGGAQIVIDPSDGRARIYSGNYKYDRENGKGQGLMIDLSENPEIKFGSGNFEVSSEGYITARGGGTIAGWNIDNDSLFTGKVEDKDKSNNVRISSKEFNRSINNVSRENLSLALGDKFAVSFDGIMYAGDAIIGTGTNKITIGKSAYKEGEDEFPYSAMYSGKISFDDNRTGFYMGTDGISLGAFDGNSSVFQVDSSGKLIARSGIIGYVGGKTGWNIGTSCLYNNKTNYNNNESGIYIGTSGIGLGGDENTSSPFYVDSSGKLHSVSGDIGGWTIKKDSLSTNDQTLKYKNPNKHEEGYAGGKKTPGIYLGSAGIALGNNFSVDSSGNLYAINGDFEGKITSSSGSIGGWTINQSSITNKANKDGQYIELNGDGSITTSTGNWSIQRNGEATFKSVKITDTSTIGSGATIGNGANIGSVGSVSGGNVSIGGTDFKTEDNKKLTILADDIEIYKDGRKNAKEKLKVHIDNLIVDKLEITGDFKFKNYSIVLRQFMTGIGKIDAVNNTYSFYTGLAMCVEEDTFSKYHQNEGLTVVIK